jgi:ADP-ribose pyrophosphatase YjhB (NUDIX family)
LEFGDTVEQTLRSEIKQEYGTEVLQFEFLGYRDVHREHEDQPTHWIALDFKALIDPKQVKNGEPNKFDEVRFFRLESLPENIHSQLPHFLQIYRDQL